MARCTSVNPEYRYTFYKTSQATTKKSKLDNSSKTQTNSNLADGSGTNLPATAHKTHHNDSRKFHKFFKASNTNSDWSLGGKTSMAWVPYERFDKNPNFYTLEMVINK